MCQAKSKMATFKIKIEPSTQQHYRRIQYVLINQPISNPLIGTVSPDKKKNLKIQDFKLLTDGLPYFFNLEKRGIGQPLGYLLARVVFKQIFNLKIDQLDVDNKTLIANIKPIQNFKNKNKMTFSGDIVTKFHN